MDDALERALIFLRLRLSLRERFFFHFSLIVRYFELQNKSSLSTDRIVANQKRTNYMSEWK